MKVKNSQWEATASGREGFPTQGLFEIAFLGRSNVGKSSLLNRLLQRKNLARTSSTPGKTRLLHFYRVTGEERSLLFVDLPGYGYAKVSMRERQQWKPLIEDYLSYRPVLAGAVLLHDVRRDFSQDEVDILEWLNQRGIANVLVLTKLDKLRPGKRSNRVRELRRAIEGDAARVIVTSAVKGEGIEELWAVLDRFVVLHAQRRSEAFAEGRS